MKSKKWLLGALFGVIPAALLLLASTYTIRSLGDIVSSVGTAFQMGAEDIETYSMILGQLQTAAIRTPVLPVLLLCCAAAALTAKWLSKSGTGKRRAAAVILWIPFLLLLFVFTLLFTEVNTILLGLLLRSFAALL